MQCNCVELSRIVPYGTTSEKENVRLSELQRSGILDSSPQDINFDRLTNLASRYFKMPVVLVSIADVNRLWLKSRVGLPVSEINRDFAFCNYTIRDDAPPVFIVLDADKDPRFCDKPFVVGPPFAKFYAGAPVMCNNIKLGSFCVLDGQAHSDFDEEKQIALTHFASLASDLIAQNKESNYIKKYDPSLLSSAILQVLQDPLQNALNCSSELGNAFATIKKGNTETKIEDAKALIKTFDIFHGSSLILQRSLEVALRFASSVAHEQPRNISNKRKAQHDLLLSTFMKEVQRIGKIDGYEQNEWKYNANIGPDIYIQQDPTTLAAIAGFLSLKHLNTYSQQHWFVNFIPLSDKVCVMGSTSSVESVSTLGLSSSSSSFSPATEQSLAHQTTKGLLQLHGRFSKVVIESSSSKNNAANKERLQSIDLSPYDIRLIKGLLFGMDGTFEALHLETDPMNREFRLTIATTYSYRAPPAGNAITWDGSARLLSSSSPAIMKNVVSPNQYESSLTTNETDSDSSAMLVVTNISDSEGNLSPFVSINQEAQQPPLKKLTVADPFAETKAYAFADSKNHIPSSAGGGTASSPLHGALGVLISIVTSRPSSAKVHP